MKPALPADSSVPVPAPVYGPSNPTPAQLAAAPVKAYGSVIALTPELEQKYRELHADVWPAIVAAQRRAHIQNYHIYAATLAGRRYLFSYFEYTGTDFAADRARIAQDPVTRDQWWPLTDACQLRLPGTPQDEQWLPLEQLMHLP